MVERLINTLEGGCDLESPPRSQPSNTYRWARNVQANTKRGRSGGRTNEGSTIRRREVPGRKAIGYMRIEERNATLIFHIDAGNCLSIFYHDTKELQFVVRDKEFGCDWKFQDCLWMGHGFNGSKTIAPCNDLLVYFVSDDFSRVVNIDEMLDSKRKAAIKELEKPCEHFLTIKPISGPRLRGRPMRGGGKDLEGGAYYYSARFKDESGNTSNFTPVNGPVYIGTKHNLPGEKSKQAIRLEVRNMPKHYTRVEIVVIPPIGSQTQDVAYSIYDGVYNTNGVSVVYYSQSQHLSFYPMEQILGRDIKWIRPHKMFIDDARLNLYQLRQPFNLNYQKHANKIKVTFLAFLVPSDQAHLFKSLPRDEPIAFGIGMKALDQTYSPYFHIRGPGGGSNENLSCACDLPPGHTGNNASIKNEYLTFDGKGNIYCYTSGQTTTSNPQTSDVYNPPSKCQESGEQPITPRSSEAAECNDGTKYESEQDKETSAFTSNNDSLDSCLDCPPDSVRTDLDHMENSAVRGIEHMTDLFRTDKEVYDDCTIGKHTTIPGASHDAYEKGIKDAPKNEEVTYRTVVEKKDGTDFILSAQSGGTMKRVTVKGEDCATEDVIPWLWREYEPAGWESRRLYPKTKDCDDQYFHEELAGQRIRHPKTPGFDICPTHISAQTGVESRFDPSNIPGKSNTYAVILGVRFTNIHIPTEDEVFTPLDDNEPYRIGIVPPQEHNRSNLYHGYVTPTFEGKVGGKTFQFPRHAVSAFPTVDRSIDDEGSRKGKDSTLPLYNFHSPDIIGGSSFVYGDYVQVHGFLDGVGMVYGQYAKGKRVKEDENRKDRRGSRGAINLINFTAQKFVTCLKGAEVAEHNSVLQNPTGIQRPLMNKYRESSIYFETEQPLPTIGNGDKDRSFTGGGLDHEYFTSGKCWFVSIKRFNADQYGDLESMQYADLGLIGRKGQTTIEGPVGTCFVQKWSHKRTSYISDKQGNYLNEDLRAQFPRIATEEYLGPPEARKRGVPDPPNRRNYRMEEYLGFWNSQRLPMPGDKRDPKNMANLFPTFSAQEIAGMAMEALTDLFYARTHVQLNHMFIQTDVNLYYRSTNEPATREVFAEELEGLELDSSITGADPEDSWLNDFHSEHLQPSDKQQELKIRIRVFLGLIMPYILLTGFAGMASEIEATSTVIAAPGLLLLWRLAVGSIFTPKKIDKFKGIPHAKMDKEGGQEYDNLKGLKDNWGAYNWGFSDINDINVFLGQPYPYNTCKCVKYTNNIRSSNQQIHTSPYDAWSNFQALNLMGLEGDSGQIQLIVVWNNQVFAHTTDGVYPLQHKNLAIPTSAGAQVLGGSTYHSNPPRMRAGAFEGYAGTEDPNAGIIFRDGYLSIDYEGRGINLLAGDFKKLNDEKCGIYSELRDNFTFCSKGTCRDQLTPGSVHFALGYDPEREMLLITKHDSTPWTWSYDLRSQKFVSQHDYTPDFYFWDRNTLFSVKDGVIWEHNDPNSFCNFYGKQYEASIEIPVHTADSAPFKYFQNILDTEVRVGDLRDRQASFSSVLVYNEKQTTGVMPLVISDRNNARAAIQGKPEVKINRDVNGLWTFNDLKANELDRDVPIMIDKPCGQPDEFNTKNFTLKKNHVHNREIWSKFLIFKFNFAGEMNGVSAATSELVVTKLITDVTVHEDLRKQPG